MSRKVDSAAIRVRDLGGSYEVSVVHRGRRGRQNVVQPMLCVKDLPGLRQTVMEAYALAEGRLRFPEEI